MPEFFLYQVKYSSIELFTYMAGGEGFEPSSFGVMPIVLNTKLPAHI